MHPHWFENFFTLLFTALSSDNDGPVPFAFPRMQPFGATFMLGGLATGGGFASDAAAAVLYGVRGELAKINGNMRENRELMENLQSMLNATAEENRKTMQDLKLQLRTFEENMNHKIEELKGFMIEKTFIDNVVNRIETTWDYMNRMIATNTTQTKKDFMKKYNVDNPMMIIMGFTSSLKNRLSNPVVAAMKAHVFNSRVILQDYTSVITALILKAVAVESGYFIESNEPKNETAARLDQLNNDANTMYGHLREYVTSYKLVEKEYWPDAVIRLYDQKFSGETIKTESDVMKSGERIWQHLEGINTKDVFIVYQWEHNDGYTGEYLMTEWIAPEEKDTYVGFHYVNESKHTRIVIVRSRAFHEIPTQQVELMRTAFRSFALTEARLYKQFNLVRPFAPEKAFGHQFRLMNPSFPLANVLTVFNVTPTVRFTNNGASILQDQDQTIIPIFHGITWK